MKRILLTLTVSAVFSSLFAQTGNNPFAKLGYKKHIMYTSSKGEFEEFHDMDDVVEIGSALFNTKTNQIVGFIDEQQEETEIASATAAMSIDPLCEKYYWITPYAYTLNNPIRVIDPDGREGIVVTGGEFNDPDRYKYNFVEPAITRLKELVAAGGSEPITWAVMAAGYSEKDMAVFQAIANDLGVGFQAIGSADELTNYLNSKDVGSSGLSEARTGDQITSMSVFGHGTAIEGQLPAAQFAYRQSNASDFSWSTDNVTQLNAGAFNNATIDLYTCNSATNTTISKSLGYVLSQQTGSTVTGYSGQSTYRLMNAGGIFTKLFSNARLYRELIGFNPLGSIKLPQAGEGATRIKFLPFSK